MKLSEIKKILDAKIITCENQKNKELISAGGADLMDDVLVSTAKDSVLLTGQIKIEVIEVCNMAEVGAIVFVRGKKPEQKMIDSANTYNIPILLTDYSMFVSCGRLYMNGLRGFDGSW